MRVGVPQILILVGAIVMFVSFFALDGISGGGESKNIPDFIDLINDSRDAGNVDDTAILANFWWGILVMAAALGAVIVFGAISGRFNRSAYLMCAVWAVLALGLNFVGWIGLALDDSFGGEYFLRPITGFMEVDNASSPAFPVISIGAVVAFVGAMVGLSRPEV
jgi:hypothetical protein